MTCADCKFWKRAGEVETTAGVCFGVPPTPFAVNMPVRDLTSRNGVRMETGFKMQRPVTHADDMACGFFVLDDSPAWSDGNGETHETANS